MLQFIVTCIVIGIAVAVVKCDKDVEKVKISVFYETLCPFSRAFIVDQVWPAYGLLGDRVEIDVIPHGHSNKRLNRETNVTEYQCQHKEKECFMNKVHTCIAHSDKYTTNQKLGFMQCTMSHSGLSNSYNLCADSHKVDSNVIEKCLNSTDIEDVLDENDRRTKAVIPLYSKVVPLILYNDIFYENLNSLSRKHLLATICSLYSQDDKPQACN